MVRTRTELNNIPTKHLVENRLVRECHAQGAQGHCAVYLPCYQTYTNHAITQRSLHGDTSHTAGSANTSTAPPAVHSSTGATGNPSATDASSWRNSPPPWCESWASPSADAPLMLHAPPALPPQLLPALDSSILDTLVSLRNVKRLEGSGTTEPNGAPGNEEDGGAKCAAESAAEGATDGAADGAADVAAAVSGGHPEVSDAKDSTSRSTAE